MKPLHICQKLGVERIATLCEELNSSQLKTTLKQGTLSPKVPSRVVSQKARRKLWLKRLQGALADGNEAVASSLLYEWLLGHRRAMLAEYLDLIGVKHRGGETEESFTKTVPVETLLASARTLAKSRPPEEVATYLLYLDHHQESDVFTSSPEIVALLAGAAKPEPTDAETTTPPPAEPAD